MPDLSTATVELPAAWAGKVEGRTSLRQMVRRAGIAICTSGEEGRTLSQDGADIPVARDSDDERNSLRYDLDRQRWVGVVPTTAAEVVATWRGAFIFRTATDDPNEGGLRRPQIGALHAVLGQWTTGSMEPATVVMPTGTGKTDTMLALLVAAQLPRLLVVVPTDALRSQIAAKFEELGLLRQLGVIATTAQEPVVGRVLGRLQDAPRAVAFAESCNVVIATAQALSGSQRDVVTAFYDCFSAVFFDEAHHIRAETWSRIREAFADKSVVQFTATPFREDGKQLGGRLVYNFPLRQAQADGYFSPIRYASVFDLEEPDQALAIEAVAALRRDLTAGLDHLLMARAASIPRARELIRIYRGLVPEANPVELHTGVGKREHDLGLAALRSRQSRVVVCVDMLGEGFDLPQLKIAALHDPRRSLGPTLQLVGRFTRTAEHVGTATVVAARTEQPFDTRLRRLYGEDADWNELIEELSSDAIGEQREISEFESGFGSQGARIATRSIAPKMSTVVYRTTCADWVPEAVTEVIAEEDLITSPIPVNYRDHVLWFVLQQRQSLPWIDAQPIEDVTHALFVLYWDPLAGLLYINSSANEGTYEQLAKAVCGADSKLIRDDEVYRAMGGLDRPVPTNVGVLDIYNRGRRFSMHVGADVSQGLPSVEESTKIQTNIFAVGFRAGERDTVGASIKGRIWSYQAARNITQWMKWCDGVGERLLDDTIDISQLRRNFIRPEPLDRWPALIPLALEWPTDLLLNTTEGLRLAKANAEACFYDVGLRLDNHVVDNSVRFSFITDEWEAQYDLVIDADGMRIRAVAEDVAVLTPRTSTPASLFFSRVGLVALMSGDALVSPPGVLYRPHRSLPSFPRENLVVLDWIGRDISNESRGQTKDEATVQGRMLSLLLDEDWDIVVDDDGKGEIADLVALRERDGALEIRLVHCKYAPQGKVGARVGDLYELCGQAHKSVVWRREPEKMMRRLVQRERSRRSKGRRTGFEKGTARDLVRLLTSAPALQTGMTMTLAQPGLTRTGASDAQLELLGATQVYLFETGATSLEVICSP